ncbi:MAG: winged helix-turn-helix domain-containing protein, partial [Elusimicrobiota bacterium]
LAHVFALRQVRVWGYAAGIKSRTVDRHIENLRIKLRPQQYRIETHYGLGYSFTDNLPPKQV